ncbi:MAG: hypothetical protein KDM64_12435, partial [Verrucomicrobiae bacterium]|nr:hypothetical protein [Verrucomicrobiae bacterium]
MNPADTFLLAMGRLRASLRPGLLALSLGPLAAGLILLSLLVGVSDYLIGWEIPARLVIAILLGSVV